MRSDAGPTHPLVLLHLNIAILELEMYLATLELTVLTYCCIYWVWVQSNCFLQRPGTTSIYLIKKSFSGLRSNTSHGIQHLLAFLALWLWCSLSILCMPSQVLCFVSCWFCYYTCSLPHEVQIGALSPKHWCFTR